MLYILSFLHQTTTLLSMYSLRSCCISYHFYIKPQLSVCPGVCPCGCISYHFYIKPQPGAMFQTNSTSCISYHFYIKPQLSVVRRLNYSVVYLIISTSNHNLAAPAAPAPLVVYLIISTSNHNAVDVV